jgi:hypothetical protein
MSVERCKALVWADWNHVGCHKPAKKDGFCGMHHPDAVKRRKELSAQRMAKTNAALKAKFDAERLKTKDAAIGALVRLKMTSGNEVPVERCTITREEIAELLS